MKKIEKEIKKNSQELIESSLPEIDKLDNIPIKAKANKKWPFVFAPLGAVALVLTAILVPTLVLRQGVPSSLIPGVSNPPAPISNSFVNDNSGVNPISDDNNNSHPIEQPVIHTYNFDFKDYSPTFNDFNEIAYYSYIAYDEASNSLTNNALKHNKVFTASNEDIDDQEERSRYIDAYGRTHYPIELADEYTFSNFLFFEFESSRSTFLEERIGNGHIHGLVIQLSVFNDEQMLILKNGEKYYSCLTNGAGNNGIDNSWRIEFSAHKTIEGFDVVKDVTNKRYVTLTIDDMNDFNTLSSINVEGRTFSINPETVHYDNVTITCSVADIREQLALNPDYQVANSYGGNDIIVYDANEPENNTFTLDEFEGTFSVNDGIVTLDGEEVVTVGEVSKIYASEINKDFHRDLVFETTNKIRYFGIFDVVNKKHLYYQSVTSIGEYDYYLDMKDGRLVVKVLEPGMTDDSYMLDYGYFAYRGNNGISIAWQNLFELTNIRLSGVYEADGETPVPFLEAHYRFNSKTPYILEIKLNKWPGNKNPDYPNANEHPLVCAPYDFVENMPNQNPTLTYLSMKNGVYRYQISFEEKGYSYYSFTFYRYSFDLRAAVDEPLEAE